MKTTTRTDFTEAELRRAWRECALLNLPFERAMEIPAMAIAIRNMADVIQRRNERLAELQRTDRKRAQANDLFDNLNE
jgi:hypothetical protein